MMILQWFSMETHSIKVNTITDPVSPTNISLMLKIKLVSVFPIVNEDDCYRHNDETAIVSKLGRDINNFAIKLLDFNSKFMERCSRCASVSKVVLQEVLTKRCYRRCYQSGVTGGVTKVVLQEVLPKWC